MEPTIITTQLIVWVASIVGMALAVYRYVEMRFNAVMDKTNKVEKDLIEKTNNLNLIMSDIKSDIRIIKIVDQERKAQLDKITEVLSEQSKMLNNLSSDMNALKIVLVGYDGKHGMQRQLKELDESI